MNEMKYCCETFKEWCETKVIDKDISGYWIWLDGSSNSDWELIKFCPFCGKKLMKREIVKRKDKPEDTTIYASLRR